MNVDLCTQVYMTKRDSLTSGESLSSLFLCNIHTYLIRASIRHIYLVAGNLIPTCDSRQNDGTSLIVSLMR